MTYDYQTSLPAFKEPGKDQCREKVFEAIKALGICTDKQIAQYLGWEINRVTGRRGELHTAGKIEWAGRWKSGRFTVNWWKLPVTQGQLF